MIARVILNLSLAAAFACWADSAQADDLPYYFIQFEVAEGYRPGPFDQPFGGIEVLQGSAQIQRDRGPDAGQYLVATASDPYTAIHLTGDRPHETPSTHYEVWVRPSATAEEDGEEFLDFDGSVVGFFSDESTDQGTFFVYHVLSPESGYWVSTGVTAPIDADGVARQWVRIGIHQNLALGTWDLKIASQAALGGIRQTEKPEGRQFNLWFYGHSFASNSFDDLLITSLDPDKLQSHIERLHDSRKDPLLSKLARDGSRRVGRSQQLAHRRRSNTKQPDGKHFAVPRVLDVEIDIIDGARQHSKSRDASGEIGEFIIYSPSYDDDGNPLPLKVSIHCDAELKEGAKLADIMWAIREARGKDRNQDLRVVAHGNFETGLTQIAEVPSDWARKATSITVGTNLRFKISQPENERP